MSKISRISITILLISLLAACGMNDDENVDEKNTGTESSDTTDTNTNNTDAANDQTATDDMNKNNLKTDDDISDKVAEMEEVESANVLVTDNNAYVAVVLKEGIEETEEMKSKIADEVKATKSDYKNVYVSASPDFAERFTSYGDKIRAGEPVEGFFEEFTETVRSIFPDSY